MLQLTCYGGVGQIGGNQFLLEDGHTRLILDFGTPFGPRGLYYEEYLKPRSALGLLDPLTMRLLPPLQGLYRPDMEAPAQHLWEELRESGTYRDLRDVEINAIILSHAHIDHTGYLSFVRGDIPVISGAVTAFMAKAVQDSGRSDFESEVAYITPRTLGASGLLETGNWRAVAAEQRPFQVFGYSQLGDEAHDFWRDTPGGRPLASIPLAPPRALDGLEIIPFPVDHSIPGAHAFAFRTSIGWVVYTGDLRLHGHAGYLTRRFVEQLRALKPAVMICEGTRATLAREEHRNFTEQEVKEHALMEARQATGLIIADFGPRNIERLLIFAEIAREVGRALVILPKDAYMLKAAHLADPDIPSALDIPDLFVYDEPKGSLMRWEKAILAECQDRLLSQAQVAQQQDQYILCFSFFDLDQLPTLRPRPGSLYLYSSNEAFNEEIQMDFKRLRAWIEFFNMRRVGVPLEEMGWHSPEGEEGLHASGHADPKSLLEIVREVSPKTLIPIHTTPEGIEYFQRRLAGESISIEVACYGCPIVLG